jgi:hypothetical protein
MPRRVFGFPKNDTFMEKIYMKYFRFFCSEDKKIAMATTSEVFFTEERLPAREIEQQEWDKIIYRSSKGILPDIIPEDNALVLVSKKFQQFLMKNKLLPANIQLIENPVVDPKGNVHRYYIVHIKKPVDLLNKKFSFYDDIGLIKPVLDAKKVKDLEFFSWSSETGNASIVVSERVKKLLIQEGMIGLLFSPMPVA